jgi:methionine biosynthesis protein MetW
MTRTAEPRRKRMPVRYCIPDPSTAVTDKVIRAQIQPGSRVVDLGCADGRLLELLRDEHGCDVLGIELDEELIVGAIGRGVPVIQNDLDHGLPDLPDAAFDVAVLSQTLQQLRRPQDVLREMLRVARRALVVVPNFGHWRVRLQLVLQGRAPVTSTLPYEWYDTPNLHVMSMHDFRELADTLRCRIVQEVPIIKSRAVDRAWAANLRAESVLYVLERSASPPLS